MKFDEQQMVNGEILNGLDQIFPADRLLCDPAYLAAFES